ncbi:MAG: hypothetical protein ACRYGG_17050, partial [Janthinobacterium lividum]
MGTHVGNTDSASGEALGQPYSDPDGLSRNDEDGGPGIVEKGDETIEVGNAESEEDRSSNPGAEAMGYIKYAWKEVTGGAGRSINANRTDGFEEGDIPAADTESILPSLPQSREREESIEETIVLQPRKSSGNLPKSRKRERSIGETLVLQPRKSFGNAKSAAEPEEEDAWVPDDTEPVLPPLKRGRGASPEGSNTLRPRNFTTARRGRMANAGNQAGSTPSRVALRHSQESRLPNHPSGFREEYVADNGDDLLAAVDAVERNLGPQFSYMASLQQKRRENEKPRGSSKPSATPVGDYGDDLVANKVIDKHGKRVSSSYQRRKALQEKKDAEVIDDNPTGNYGDPPKRVSQGSRRAPQGSNPRTRADTGSKRPQKSKSRAKDKSESESDEEGAGDSFNSESDSNTVSSDSESDDDPSFPSDSLVAPTSHRRSRRLAKTGQATKEPTGRLTRAGKRASKQNPKSDSDSAVA